MFIRVKTTPNSPRKSVQIVESYRQADGVRQRILRHIGVADDDAQLQKLKELATFTMAEMRRSVQPDLFSAEERAQQIIAARPARVSSATVETPLTVNLRELRETSRVTVGFHEVYGAVYRQLGFDRLMGARRVASAQVLHDLVMARLANPSSKLASAALLQRDFAIEIDVDQIYRMMDHLDDAMQTRIQKYARDAALGLLGQKIDVLFFDCTTLYFESFDEDGLRQKGFSKDHKSAETQVLLALLVTREGLPIGYRLYPGAKWEGHTLIDVIADLRKICPVERAVLVADSALFTPDNLALLDAHQQPYIVAARLKNLPQATQALLLNSSNYQPLCDGESFFETTHQQQRLIITHSEQRARKDAHERHKALERAEKNYHNKTVKSVIKGHHARYLKVQGSGRVALDPERIANAARWDGLHGIITNIKDLSVAQALSHYHGLWQVEETFRLSKHDLRIRPIFHWSERRIRSHVALCFMALTCMRWLTHTCALQYQPLSAKVIQNELAHTQVSILEEQKTKRRFAIPARPTKHAQRLFKLVGKTLNATPFEVF
jgi:transposase